MNNSANKMKEGYINYNGASYCILEVDSQLIAAEEFKGCLNLTLKIADFELWEAISNENDEPKGLEEEDIDNEIFYYCDSGFIASHPTLEEVKAYFSNVL